MSSRLTWSTIVERAAEIVHGFGLRHCGCLPRGLGDGEARVRDMAQSRDSIDRAKMIRAGREVAMGTRRVVTGLDGAGRAVVLADEVVEVSSLSWLPPELEAGVVKVWGANAPVTVPSADVRSEK